MLEFSRIYNAFYQSCFQCLHWDLDSAVEDIWICIKAGIDCDETLFRWHNGYSTRNWFEGNVATYYWLQLHLSLNTSKVYCIIASLQVKLAWPVNFTFKNVPAQFIKKGYNDFKKIFLYFCVHNHGIIFCAKINVKMI